MHITTFKKALPFLIDARIATLVWGNHGVGKSQSVKQFCEELGYHFVDLRLGTQEVGDLLGLADFKVDKDGNHIATKFMPPDWLNNLIDFCKENPKKKAIIFLDEINRARRDVLQAVFQLVLDNKIHTVQLPDNAYALGACNPNTEDYIVTDIGDAAFMDRFCHITLKPSVAEWIDYGRKKEFTPALLQFITEQPLLLETKHADWNLVDVIKPSRRSWEAVDRAEKAGAPEDLWKEIGYGLVGTAPMIAYVESRKNSDKPLSADDIINDFDNNVDKLKSYSNDKTGGRLDLLKATSDDLLKAIKARKKKYTPEQEKNILKFLKAIPVDLTFSVCKEIYIEEILREAMDNDEALGKYLEGAKAKFSK